MAVRGLLDVVHHDLLDLVGVVVVHDEHDALLEKGVLLLVMLIGMMFGGEGGLLTPAQVKNFFDPASIFIVIGCTFLVVKARPGDASTSLRRAPSPGSALVLDGHQAVDIQHLGVVLLDLLDDDLGLLLNESSPPSPSPP